MSEAQLRAIAARCEHATGSTCRCRCGGALHGLRHPEIWILNELDLLADDADRLRRSQRDLFTAGDRP